MSQYRYYPTKSGDNICVTVTMVWKILQRNVRYVLYTGAFTAYGMSVIHCVTNYMVSIAVVSISPILDKY